MQIYCEATNKWGTVKSKIVYLRIGDEERKAHAAAHAPKAGGDVRVVAAGADKQKDQHKQKFGATLADVDNSKWERQVIQERGALRNQQDGGAAASAAAAEAPLEPPPELSGLDGAPASGPTRLNEIGRKYSGVL